MSKNLFESSIEKNESIDFFLGEGTYFSRNRETHEHAYFAQVKGWVKQYIDKNPDENILIFLRAFNDFLKNKRSSENLAAALEPLLAITIISKKNPNYFKTTPAKEISKTYDSIENYFSSNTFNTEELNDIIIYKERISELGCKTLSKKIST